MALQQKTVWGDAVRRPAGAAVGLAVASALILSAPPPASAQARLPESLKRLVRAQSTQSVDLIVHGSADEIAAIAARHGLRVRKRLSEGAVLQADGAQIGSLSAEVDHLSRDVEVSSFMSVTDAAIGADQVQAGLAGVGAYTGAGVGVALVDSGIKTRSLTDTSAACKSIRSLLLVTWVSTTIT